LGDYSQRVVKKSKAGRVAWRVADDGDIFEIEKSGLFLDTLAENDSHLTTKIQEK
jgi:hypothetical protein